MPCSDCVSYIAIDATTGECHNAPPIPEGEFPLCKSEWPVVQATDECGQYSLGAHPGTVCSSCANYNVLPASDPGACNHPGKPEDNDSICADAECFAIPPTPTGSYRGDLSEWPRVMDDDPSCTICYAGL